MLLQWKPLFLTSKTLICKSELTLRFSLYGRRGEGFSDLSLLGPGPGIPWSRCLHPEQGPGWRHLVLSLDENWRPAGWAAGASGVTFQTHTQTPLAIHVGQHRQHYFPDFPKIRGPVGGHGGKVF